MQTLYPLVITLVSFEGNQIADDGLPRTIAPMMWDRTEAVCSRPRFIGLDRDTFASQEAQIEEAQGFINAMRNILVRRQCHNGHGDALHR